MKLVSLRLSVADADFLSTAAVTFSAGPPAGHRAMISPTMASTTSTALTRIAELSGTSPKVASKEYTGYTDEALDGEIVASVNAAQSHYDGLRRVLILRLLPALAEMRQRHGKQGVRNDLNRRLGLPVRAGWEDYLRSRGLKPDTVRGWFQRHAAVQTLGLLVGATTPRKASSQPAPVSGNEPRLYRVNLSDRTLVVAAYSAKRAIATLQRGMFGLNDDRPRVEELGQVIEIQGGRISQRRVRQFDIGNTVPERTILRALTDSPDASPGQIAQRLGVSVVDVRRVETKHRGRLSRR